MRKLQVGVIGTGVMGERHCRVYAGLPGVELVGVHDRSPDRAIAVARKHGTRFFSVRDDLLAQVDAISIVTSTPMHAEVALAALERGVHVLIEKPIAQTMDEAAAIASVARRTGCVVQVGHIERFNPTYTELQHVLSGMTPLAITMRRLSPFMTSATDVDVVCDLMIHDIDLSLGLCGGVPSEVQAAGRTVYQHGVDHVVATLGFADGPIATLFASRVTEQKVRDIVVVAKEAYIEADLLTKSIAIHHRTMPEYLQGKSTVKYRQESLIERIVVPASEPLQLELQHFVDCITGGTQPMVGPDEAMAALELALRIRGMVQPAVTPVSVPLALTGEAQRSRMVEAV